MTKKTTVPVGHLVITSSGAIQLFSREAVISPIIVVFTTTIIVSFVFHCFLGQSQKAFQELRTSLLVLITTGNE